MKKIIFLIVLVFIVIVVLLTSQHEISAKYSEEISFKHDNETIVGTLYLPTKNKPCPVILFVHGDGAQDRTANGNYTIMMNIFLKNGIGVFSYDKAGVGDSSGNWLYQTMADRGTEVIKAVNALKKNRYVDKDKIGLIGFSQAGWVIPKIARKEYGIAYVVIVGGAINWMEQKDFYEKNQLNRLGYIPKSTLDKKRQVFIELNKNADASKDLRLVNIPLLGIFAKNDLHVNAKLSYEVYSKIFKDVKHSKIILISNATHSMLKANSYDSFSNDFTLWNQVKYFIEGEDAFNPLYINILIKWIKENNIKVKS